MHVQPYLFFSGRLEEALAFYEKAIGAKTLFKMRFSDAPPEQQAQQKADDCEPVPGWGEKIMHASFSIGDSVLMGSDGMGKESHEFKGFNLSISVKTNEEGERVLKALAEGGKINMPFQKTFWTAGFGMAQDKFGMGWMVSVEQAPQ